eukprot:s4767_g4.t1
MWQPPTNVPRLNYTTFPESLRFFIWEDLPDYDFYVMQPSKQIECFAGITGGGARHRDKRRLAVVNGGGSPSGGFSVVSPAGGSSLIPAGIEQPGP